MILILSSDQDSSTNKVIDWLTYYNKPWVRINDTTPLKILLTLSNDQFEIELFQDAKKVVLSTITSYWYRKGNFKFEWEFSTALRKSPLAGQIHYYLTNEINALQEFLHYCLKSKKGIGNYLTAAPNKLKVLLQAKSIGFNIPHSVITNDPPYAFNNNHEQQWISKAIWEALYCYSAENGAIQTYTNLIDRAQDNQTHFPSLFQHAIAKEYEVRVFYLKRTCYAMAIFSQADHKTAVDFRKYNDEKPNRTVPYQLPLSIIEQIHQLMKALELVSGSIDLIKAKNGAYFFLEVNPVGQFGMVSSPCNYPIEEHIAQAL